ncbi:MAG: hypothetical protein ACFCBW_07180 [Candidatus Competibacterales bacterium]
MAPSPGVTKPAALVALPRGMVLKTDPQGLEVEVSWSRWRGVGLLFLGVGWGVSLFFGLGAFGALPPEAVLPLLRLTLVVGCYVLAGGVVIYLGLAHGFNTTRISVSQDAIVIATRPLPWFGDGRWAAVHWRATEVRERVVPSGPRQSQICYDVWVIFKARRPRGLPLVRGLETPSQGAFIEGALERLRRGAAGGP